MKNITLCFLLLFCSFFNAQKWQPIYYADYSYANRNQIKAGLEWFVSNPENDNRVFLGSGFNVVYHNNEIRFLPDLHISHNSESGFFIKTGSSLDHAYVLGGISMLNALDLGVGYSVPYQLGRLPIKGFTVGLTVRLTNNNQVYNNFNIGF
ncbi:hypothetical protein [Chryseobacterium foetidum]|uniref:hypothetical protein n=1 Tax=Chryseobacterium foetidum TaxID=2951057 RepID=UPI0021C683D4|nr:hypothetical protein [Chryseobacterium foetidum]